MALAEDIFEDEVRRIARARWPQAALSGATMLDGRERDGRFETDECVHFLEATVSRGTEKAREDTKKLFKAVSAQHKLTQLKAARGWLVTQSEPTADQRKEVDQYGKGQVSICSFNQFQSAIVDGAAYLAARSDHFFGSVLDPGSNDPRPQVAYVEMDIIEPGSEVMLRIKDIAADLSSGSRLALLGDYGAGKSMTLRQCFFALKEQYLSHKTRQFPVYINLREHSGQDDPAEMLERHARRIGFSNPSSLVRAWKAGFVILLADGFDEITTLGVTGFRTKLRELRRDSLQALKRLLQQSPSNVGWIIAGREHFFDSPSERAHALGLPSDTRILSLNEFTETQIREYLNRATGNQISALPYWLPTRPLLVGHFVARGLISSLPSAVALADAVDGWDYLIDQICERESRIAPTLDGDSLRRVFERLATIARSTADGLGPLTQEQIRDAFVSIVGYEPGEQANLILQRMPGLGVYRVEDNSRAFIDRELAEICRSRDVCDFVSNPYLYATDPKFVELFSPITNAFGTSAALLAARRNTKNTLLAGQLRGALAAIATRPELKVLTADIVLIALAAGVGFSNPIKIAGVLFEDIRLELSSDCPDLSGVQFANCFFDAIELDSTVSAANLPKFAGCMIVEIDGRSSPADLPDGCFASDCLIESFSTSLATSSAIMGAPLERGERILLTLLRKLFVQSLSGRLEGALVRGLDLNDRGYVTEMLRLLQQQGIVFPPAKGDSTIWMPNRKQLGRVRRLLSAPSTCQDPVLELARSIVG